MLRSQPTPPAGAEGVRRAPPGAREGVRFAGFTPGSYDPTTRSVEAVLSVGTAVDRGDFIEELLVSADAVDLSRAASGLVPLLNAHNRWDIGGVLGGVRECRVEGGRLIGRLYFADTDQGRQAEGMVARGELRGVSIGYNILRWEVVIDGPDEQNRWRATRWELMEASLVPVPADPATGVRSASEVNTPTVPSGNAANQEEEEMIRSQPGGAAAPAQTTAAAPAGQPAAPSMGQAASEASPPAPAAEQRSTPATLSASTALAFVEQARAFGDTIATRAQELVGQVERGTMTLEAARADVLRSAAEAQRAATGSIGTGGRVITISEDERDKFRRGAENSILQRAGLTDLIQRAARARGETVDLDPGEFRGIRNAELARLALERAGHRVDSYDREFVVGQALALRMGPFQSTSDFPVILDAVANRTLQASYAVTPDTWRAFCATGSVSDFRPSYNLLLGTFSGLDPVLEDGEIKSKPIPDGAREAISVTPKGNIIGLTRQAIVNDDLGAFNDLAVQLGRAGKLSIERDVYALLQLNGGLGPIMSDGKTLFHADHANIVDPGGPLTIAQFEKMDLLFAQQKDLSGNELLALQLHTLVTPRAQRGDALVINEAEYDTDTAGKFQKPNKVRGLFQEIVGTARLPGTRRYGFADPSVAPTLKVNFLNGNQEPRVETKDGWRIDGTEWRVLFDYGVGAINWRTGVTDAGQ